MAKYRHNVFEMYDFRDEAIDELTPKTVNPAAATTSPESWTFEHLAISRREGVTLIQFKDAQDLGPASLNSLRADFTQLAERLVRDSKVLFDFSHVNSICAASIEELALLKQKLRNKGSRIALCCLAPAARESFFRSSAPSRQPNER